VKIYTREGDDGSTGLYFGGRVSKGSGQIELNGTIDEAQASLGVARSLSERGSRIDLMLVSVERDLWVLMAEVATSPENRRKLKTGSTEVNPEMVSRLEGLIDELASETTLPKEFVVPGESRLSAALDVARTVIRRAERLAVAYSPGGSQVVPYLNRLSDLVWAMARFSEGSTHRLARDND
jgi:cob(I)alamin adenosyltransferase